MNGDVQLSCSNCKNECSGLSAWKIVRECTEIYGIPEFLNFGVKCPNAGVMRESENNGVPAIYHDADYSKFNFEVYQKDTTKLKRICDSFFYDFDKWEMRGKGIYLWSSTPGSGKTLLACCLARSGMIKHNLQMRFITTPDYISLVGDSYKRERCEEDQSQIFKECRLLVLDDIGSQKKGDWQEQELFRLINGRLENGLVTVYTSNSDPEGLNVGNRSINRIVKSTVSIHMPEESIRRMKAKEETEAFLKDLGI